MGYGFRNCKFASKGANLENQLAKLKWKCVGPLKCMPNNEMDWAFCVLKDDDGHYYIYYVRPYCDPCRRVYRMRSSDGKTSNWIDDPVYSVLKGKEGTKYDGGTTCPTVWKENDCYHMIFSGLWSIDRKWRAFYAKSTDGISWVVQNANCPIIDIGGCGDWDCENAEPTGVIKVGEIYYCWYNDIDCSSSTSRQMGVATSRDLLHWEKDRRNPIFDGGWFCPSPIKYNDKYYLFVCHMTDCLHSEIELYKCDSPTFYAADRKCKGVVKSYVKDSLWEANVLDPAFVLTDTIYRDTFLASDNQLWMYYGANTYDGGTRGIGICTAELFAT
jgi:hypothetical protein